MADTRDLISFEDTSKVHINMKLAIFTALVASAAAFAPQPSFSRGSVIVFNGLGAGGMADTRDPEEYSDDDPRKSISAAPSFEEYLKQRSGAVAEKPVVKAVKAAIEDHKLGAGGMADTRDPDVHEDEDPRKSISAAPSFEEYLKQRKN